MNFKYPIIVFITIILPSLIFSQETNYSSLLIPKELKTNANAVFRHNVIETTIDAVDRMTVKEKKIITVLNKLGKVDASMVIGYDNDTKITSLSAKIYDEFGKEIKKYSKGKFLDASAVDRGTLYSDARMKYIKYTPTNYPYTIIFETEYKTSSTGFIPRWFPTNGYYVSIEKSEYIINNPLNITIRTKKNSFNEYPIKDLSTGSNLHFVFENQPAIKLESNSIPSKEFMPYLSVALNDFTLKGVKGNATNWKEFGKWMNSKLLTETTPLNNTVVEKIKSLIKNAKNDVEKAQIVYKYVQNKTRYIGVQIGIGGWKPIASNEVDKVGYGDCKGLTNYTKVLLDAIGVKSYHALVYAKNKRNIDKDFPSIQGNHMILNIPNNGNDIWLECTSQTAPFGFLGDFTDDRDVLVITPEGGIIKHTPKYTKDQNEQITESEISINEQGNISATIKRTSTGLQYDNKYLLENETQEEIEKHYKSRVWGYNNNLEVSSIKLNNNKEKVSFTEMLNISVTDYASTSQENMLFKVNLFNRYNQVPKRYRDRKNPLKIRTDFTHKDILTITLPENYTFKSLPIEKKIKVQFGSYHVYFEKIDDRKIKYYRTHSANEGVYAKEDYKAYRKFCKSIAKHDNLRIELIKK